MIGGPVEALDLFGKSRGVLDFSRSSNGADVSDRQWSPDGNIEAVDITATSCCIFGIRLERGRQRQFPDQSLRRMSIPQTGRRRGAQVRDIVFTLTAKARCAREEAGHKYGSGAFTCNGR